MFSTTKQKQPRRSALNDESRPFKIVLFTGAGTSAEAGIPTFRYDLDGKPAFWNNIDPESVCDMNTFRQNRELSCNFHNAFRSLVGTVRPTAFHTAVKAWQEECASKGGHLVVITQNVDDLFERAGVQDVTHVHGDIRYMQCLAYNHRWFVGYEPQSFDKACAAGCGCKVCKPGVVFFNEVAPAYEPVLKELLDLGRNDVLIVLGTSCKVFPLNDVLANERVRKIFSGLDFPPSLSRDLFDDIFIGLCTATLDNIRGAVEMFYSSNPDK